MLILILDDIQCLQNVVFTFKKGSNVQNHSPSDSHQRIKNYPATKFPIPHSEGIFPYPYPLPLTLWKNLTNVAQSSIQPNKQGNKKSSEAGVWQGRQVRQNLKKEK